jgi:hypothetical protein
VRTGCAFVALGFSLALLPESQCVEASWFCRHHLGNFEASSLDDILEMLRTQASSWFGASLRNDLAETLAPPVNQ